jgi:glycosyltransferase involved in cell wall biosynthesis
VVSVADRGVPDVVVDGRTGLLAAERSKEALVNLARALLQDPVRRKALGERAMQYVATERSLQSAARALDAALRRVHVPSRAT